MLAILWIPLACVAASAQAGTPPANTQTPKRTVYDSKSPGDPKKPDSPASSSRALDTISSSTEDLNVIRDGNVRRLMTDGCAPEVAARIGDLRKRLLIATGAPEYAEKIATKRDASASESANLALAANWFKASGEASTTAAKEKPVDPLDSVLPVGDNGTPPENRGTEEKDVAALKSELERLQSSCSAAKR